MKGILRGSYICLVVLNDVFECRTHANGSRLRCHAADEPVAAAEMAALVDAGLHPRRRWLVLDARRLRGAGISRCRQVCSVAGRRRPSCFQPHCWAKLLPSDQFSFRSGHSLTAFAVATSLALFYPKMELTLMFCASSVALIANRTRHALF